MEKPEVVEYEDEYQCGYPACTNRKSPLRDFCDQCEQVGPTHTETLEL